MVVRFHLLSFSRRLNGLNGFTVLQPHHVASFPPTPVPPAPLAVQFVFVREDGSIPPLAPLYHGPYLVMEHRDTFFCLQKGNKTDVVSVNRLKPTLSDVPISLALPPLRKHPALKPPSDVVPVVLQPLLPAVDCDPTRLRFLLIRTLTKLHQAEGSALLSLHHSFWGGVLWRIQDDSLLCP